jgi:PAS domain S-box-containing protein
MHANNGFNYRLRDYILKKHGSINSFCRATGIKYPAQMTPYLKGTCAPGKKMLARLEKDGADIEWLMNGKTKSAMGSFSSGLMLSRYRMEIDSLLRHANLLYSRLSESSQSAIEAYAVLDHSLKVVDLSGSLEKFLRYEKDSLLGVVLTDLIHPDDVSDIEKRLALERNIDDLEIFQSRFKTGDGDYISVEWCMYIKRKQMSDLNEYAIIFRKIEQ